MRAADLGAFGCNLQDVIDPGGTQIVDLEAAHDEGRGLRAFDQIAMVDAEQAQEVGAAALAPAQVGGVVDQAGEVGVLEIDPDRQDVTAALDPPGEIGPVASSRAVIVAGGGIEQENCGVFAAGAARPRWRNALSVSTRPRGVRPMNPCCRR